MGSMVPWTGTREEAGERGSAGEKDIREGKDGQRSLTGLSLTDSRLLLYTRQDPELALLPAPRCCCPAALPARRLLFFSQRTPAGRARVDSRRWCARRGNCGWNETDIRREARVVALTPEREDSFKVLGLSWGLLPPLLISDHSHDGTMDTILQLHI